MIVLIISIKETCGDFVNCQTEKMPKLFKYDLVTFNVKNYMTNHIQFCHDRPMPCKTDSQLEILPTVQAIIEWNSICCVQTTDFNVTL